MKHPRAPEFSRPLQTDRVPKAGSVEKIAADAEECRLLAQRMKMGDSFIQDILKEGKVLYESRSS